MFIDVEVDDRGRRRPGALAAKLEEVCPVDIYAARRGRRAADRRGEPRRVRALPPVHRRGAPGHGHGREALRPARVSALAARIRVSPSGRRPAPPGRAVQTDGRRSVRRQPHARASRGRARAPADRAGRSAARSSRSTTRDTYVCRPHAPGEIAGALVGRRLTAAHRRGKFLWAETDDGGPDLGLHLGMAGPDRRRRATGAEPLGPLRARVRRRRRGWRCATSAGSGAR